MFLAADLLRRDGELFLFNSTGTTKETIYSSFIDGHVINSSEHTAVCVRLFANTFPVRDRLNALTHGGVQSDAIVDFIAYESQNEWVCKYFQPTVILSPCPLRFLSSSVATSTEIVDVLYAASRLTECGLVSGSLNQHSFAYVAGDGYDCAWKIITPEQMTPLRGAAFYHGACMPPSLRGKLLFDDNERIYATLFSILLVVATLIYPVYNVEVIHTDEPVFRFMYKTSFKLHPRVFPVYCELLSNAEHLKTTLTRNCKGLKAFPACW